VIDQAYEKRAETNIEGTTQIAMWYYTVLSDVCTSARRLSTRRKSGDGVPIRLFPLSRCLRSLDFRCVHHQTAERISFAYEEGNTHIAGR
jgi:hypothetical protein